LLRLKAVRKHEKIQKFSRRPRKDQPSFQNEKSALRDVNSFGS
jgi:hypothetical protein